LLLKSIFLPWGGLVEGLVLMGAPLSWTIALDLSTSGTWLKASALTFRRVVVEPPIPSAMTVKPTEENTRNAAMIFFIDFGGLGFRTFKDFG